MSDIWLVKVTVVFVGRVSCGGATEVAADVRCSNENPRRNKYKPSNAPRIATMVTRSGRETNDGRWRVKSVPGTGSGGHTYASVEDRRMSLEGSAENGKTGLRQ
jgi:hypothetical protein